jgi:glycosyltransferase involved in cell wall biosynthesis
MMPFYLWTSLLTIERAFHALFPIWKAWFKAQRLPACNVVHATMAYATEPFDRAERVGALRVVDCPNSHPANFAKVWQDECDRWCPGEQVPTSRRHWARMHREVQRADVVLCPSDFVRDTMVANGVPAAKCFVNPFGVDTRLFGLEPAPPPSPRFVCVGTICLRKGHQYLFRAFEQVKQQVPVAELVCVGPYGSDFRKERPKWEGRFQHYPGLSHAELAKVLQNCTAFVLASVEEGFARVITEAMAAQLPIVATYESGAATLVRDGVEGFIVPARDPSQTARAMLKLALDSSACRRMGEAAHLRGALHNTWQDYGDRLLAEYRERLNARAFKRAS